MDMNSEKPKELYEAPTVLDIDPVTVIVTVGVGVGPSGEPPDWDDQEG